MGGEMGEGRFTAEWVARQREEWRQEPLTAEDIECYRINYDPAGWHASDYRDQIPFGACLAIERLCCEVERLSRKLERMI